MGLEDLAYKFKWVFSRLLDKPLTVLKKLWRQKTIRLAILCAVILLIVIPLVILLTAKIAFSAQGKTASDYAFKIDPISAKDIFIPDKPDFLPPVMLEQPQKEFWTSEDAMEFWTAPAEFPDEFWRNKLSESIDNILEPLP